VIVGAIDLGAPVWLVVVISVLGVFGGIYGVNEVKKRDKKSQNEAME
jgi:hypothetical protein